MRNRNNNSRDSRSRSGSSSGRSSRPEAESRFSKPSIKKSSLRVAAPAPKSDKPRSYRPRAFEEGKEYRDFNSEDRSGQERSSRPRFDKGAYGKPRSSEQGEYRSKSFRPSEGRSEFPKRDGDNRPSRERSNYSDRDRSDRKSFGDKPQFNREEGEGRPFRDRSNFSERGRSDRRPSGDRPQFNRESTERPRFSDREEGEGRPFRDRSGSPERGRSDRRPAGDRPQFNRESTERPRFADRDKPFFEEKPKKVWTGRSELKKKDELEDSSKETDSEDGLSRRVGRYTTAPNYRLDALDKKSDKKSSPKSESDERRLNRYIANSGVCSRREADELIASGQISVNGKVVTEMGYKVSLSDVVKLGQKVLNPEKFVYILINKPKDYITTTDDPEERKTVLDLIKGSCSERVYPVGRLDRNTTGLLLMTNDGDLAKKLTHPSSGIKKIYQAELDKPITTEDFEKLQEGLNLEDGFIRPDEVGIVTPDAMVVGLEIHSGRNRIVRRMFEYLGYTVQKLDRTVFAGLDKKDLPRGKWRFLSEKELIRLKFMK